MINGFEIRTKELTEYEIWNILPKISKGLLLKIGVKNAVKNRHICNVFKKNGFKTSPPRLRKIIQYIRIHGFVECLVSSSKGYWVAETKEECELHIESFNQRIDTMTKTRDALEYQMNKKFNKS